MKPFSKRYEATIDVLIELLVEEHCGGCNEETCAIRAAYDSGHDLWALYLFDSCGAASGEFNAHMEHLPKRFAQDAERERKSMVATVEHTQCEHCNAVTWADAPARCGSCGAPFAGGPK